MLKEYKGLLIFNDGLHLLKRIRSYILYNNSVIEISDKDITFDQVINKDMFVNFFGDELPGYSISLN